MNNICGAERILDAVSYDNRARVHDDDDAFEKGILEIVVRLV